MITIAVTGAIFGGLGALTGSIFWGAMIAGVLAAIIVAADDAYRAWQRIRATRGNG